MSKAPPFHSHKLTLGLQTILKRCNGAYRIGPHTCSSELCLHVKCIHSWMPGPCTPASGLPTQ